MANASVFALLQRVEQSFTLDALTPRDCPPISPARIRQLAKDKTGASNEESDMMGRMEAIVEDASSMVDHYDYGLNISLKQKLTVDIAAYGVFLEQEAPEPVKKRYEEAVSLLKENKKEAKKDELPAEKSWTGKVLFCSQYRRYYRPYCANFEEG